MYVMRNRIRPYSWGSRTAMATLLGEQSPSAEPQAELWLGAHPGDSSVLLLDDGERTLLDAIRHDPAGTLGADVVGVFGDSMPFLLKLLAADAPLSLQAHPSREQARAGFDREEQLGIALDSPSRNYRDRSHKPEMVYALTPFEALCGFRDTAASVRLLRGLDVDGLADVIDVLTRLPGEPGLRQVVITLLESGGAGFGQLISDVTAACVARSTGGSEFAAVYRMAGRLSGHHPRDPGILIALLMNRIDLAPGEAVYLPAGNLHAYLSGFGVEIMASSDNVLRGGLTTKHVDVGELTAVVNFAPDEPARIQPVPVAPGELAFRTPSPEFELSRIEVTTPGRVLEHLGPQILLAIDGTSTVRDVRGHHLTITRGRSVFLPARQGPVWVEGDGIVVRARDGIYSRRTAPELAFAS